jgi:hypothetical protein
MPLRRLYDRRDRVVDRHKKTLSCGRRLAGVPLKGGGNLCLRELANAQPTHLSKLLRQVAPNLRPRFAGLRIYVGLGLAAIWSIIANFFRKLFGLKPKS